MKKFFMLFMLSAVTLCVSAQQEIDGIFYNLNSDTKTAEVVENYDYYSGKVVIPETVEFDGTGYTVTSIGDFSFYDCGSLSQVVLPATITRIGQYSFENCASLKSINLPEGITFIGEHAFGECIDLTKMQVPGTVEEMGAGVFGGCSSLTEVTLGEGMKSLGSEAFTRCSMLETIVVPGSVQNIDSWAFSYCISLKEISIGEGIRGVGEAAFAYCNALEEIKMPTTVTYIDKQAFANCGRLARVTLSKELEEIGDRIFDSCQMLAAIHCTSATPAKVFDDKLLDLYAQTILYVPVGARQTYQEATAWNNFGDCKEIADDAVITDQLKKFANEDGVMFVVCDYNNIARVVKKDNDELYQGTVSIPATVTFDGSTYDVKYIGSGAFEYSNALENVEFPESLVGIGEWAFSGCVSLQDVVFPKNVKSIGAQSFYSCNALPGITIPAGVEFIGDCAFAGCISLKVINSEMDDPVMIFENTFDYREDQTLYVPKGCRQIYKSTEFWYMFQNIEEDEHLAIDNVIIDNNGDEIIYDLQGRRIVTPAKGIFIKNGKKIIF